MIFFFFSSRRRHTRCYRDWSSDVCSSDLTKGPAVMPMKLITDHEWVDALTAVVERGRKLDKEVVLHTHFNHPNEITAITKRALDSVFERGIITRNQSVLQRGVNDSVATMQ